MVTKTETRHAGGFIKSEANGHRSREIVTFASGAAILAGMVLGIVSADIANAAIAAVAGNTGNGTAAMNATPTAVGVRVGVYQAIFIEPASNLGTFEVFDPDGVSVGTGVVGTLFAGPVRFTISDGATDFVSGDRFTITVGATVGKRKQLNLSGGDGSEVANSVAFDDYDATSADVVGVEMARSCELVLADLTFPAGISGPQKTTAIAQLAARGIYLR